MASSMSPELQKTFENTWACEMNQQLKEMFQAKASKECLDVVKSLVDCKPKPRTSVCAFILEMKGTAESEIAPTSDPKEAVCFYYNTKGHWKHSCLKYLKGLKDGKVKKGSHSGSKGKYRLKHGELNLVMGNRKITHVTRIGKYELMLKSGVRIDLNNCCYSSKITRNIISFHDLFKDGYKFLFDNENGDILVYSNGCFMFKASPCKGIYKTVECISHNGNVILNVGSSNELDKSKLWHSRLGHVNKKHIAQLQKDGVLESFDFKSDDVCESCLLGKMTKSPFTESCERGEGLLDLVHTDVCGPFLSATKDGKRYYVTFTDDFSRYGYVYLIKHKSDTFEVFKRYQNEVENQLGRKIKLTPPRTPQLNGVAKRRNRTLLDMMWKGKRPYLGHIKIWGCEVYIRREAQDKLEARSEKCLFVSYGEESFGYLFYKPKDNMSADEEPIVNTDTQPEVVTPVKPDDISLPIRRTSGRVSKPPQFYYGFHIEEDNISDSTLSELDESANYKEAMMDVKTAFLNEKLIEDVFMAQPEGFGNTKYPKRVCKLRKAIYGLKQASRSWNLCFHEKVTQFGFSRSEDESCIYVKVSGSVVVFLIYRDRSKRLIGLSQDTYLDKILKRFKMENSKKGNLPLHNTINISKDLCPKTDEELDRMSRVPYASTIGSIMYAMTCIRPDVSFALSMVSRHQQNPGKDHWTSVKNILKYLRNTKDRFLVYGGEEKLRVTGYCDASWQTNKDDSRSQSGWVFLLNKEAVTWKSSKQDTVADSTCESEYIAACEASKEAIWMKNFIRDLGVVPIVQDPTEIFCDNESMVALTKEPKDHGKSKHIERKYHFVRSKVEEGHVIVKHIRSEDNPADPFTKALAKSRHDEHARIIGLKDNI
ncbi:retrotransposon protein, putative, ty1-copia subclass [Tanacetum coccineum]